MMNVRLLPDSAISAIYTSNAGSSSATSWGNTHPLNNQNAIQLLSDGGSVTKPLAGAPSLLPGTVINNRHSRSRTPGSSSFAAAGATTTPPSAFPQHQQPANIRSLIPAVAYQAKEQQPLSEILRNAGKRALGGGIPGAAAMAIQVVSLMWLRTTVNYQYRYGMTTSQALKHLYKEGGVLRFYRGVGPALIQGPMSRFGDTASNAGILALLESHESTHNLPVSVKTLAASFTAGAFRIFLMPVDTLKTIMQVEGKNGIRVLKAKIKAGGPTVVYHGALAASAATFAGHYPWFATYNFLNEKLPQYTELHKKLMRSAVIGFCASAISDTVSNSIRVIKTTKQTANIPMTYPQAFKTVVEADGILGLMGRGLKTKILSNGLQGLLFSVLWRIGQDMYNKNEEKK